MENNNSSDVDQQPTPPCPSVSSDKEKTPEVGVGIEGEGEEIVVEYNHNDYVDLVGPMWSPLAKSVPTVSATNALKKPGALPPFALYLQEERPKMQAEHPDISFGDLGKRLGEMWQSLELEDKKVYIERAKQISDERMMSWRETMKTLPKAQAKKKSVVKSVSAVSATKVPKKPGALRPFALYTQEQRPRMQLQYPDVTFGELARMLGESWRSLEEEKKKEYGERAKLIQEDRRRAWEEKIKSLPQKNESPKKKFLVPHRPQGEGKAVKKGPVITAVNSLAAAQNQHFLLPQGTSIRRTVALPHVNLPDGISVSVVSPAGQYRPVIKPRTGLPASPVTPRGGSRGGRGGRGGGGGRGGLTMSPGLQQPARPALVSPRRASHAPLKRKGGVLASPLPAAKRPNSANPQGRLCRLCAKGDFAVFRLERKPDIVVKVEELLDIRLDLEADRKAGHPTDICIQCCNTLQVFSDFKGTVLQAQIKLEQKIREVEVISDDSPERRIIPPPVTNTPGSIGLDTQDSITPVSEDIIDIMSKEVEKNSRQVIAPLTSVFTKAIAEVNIKQEGSVEGEISADSVIQLEVKEGGGKKC